MAWHLTLFQCVLFQCRDKLTNRQKLIREDYKVNKQLAEMVNAVIVTRGGEGLASLFVAAALLRVKCMQNCDKVEEKHQVMNVVECLVRNLMAEERCSTNDEEKSQNQVACNHNLLRKVVAKGLFTFGTKDSEEEKEEASSHKYNANHDISKMNVHTKRAVERNNAIGDCIGQGRN